jgi:hypothetical protein
VAAVNVLWPNSGSYSINSVGGFPNFVHRQLDAASTEVVQIQGDYSGTIGILVAGRESTEDQVSLTFQQGVTEITATYKSAKGAQGRGQGSYRRSRLH